MVAVRYNAISKQSLHAQMIDFYPNDCLQNDDWILYRDIENVPNALDTFRVLIEHGGSNPMQTDNYHRTTLHRYRGPAEILRYMLHQDHSQIDLLEEDSLCRTVIERQFWRLTNKEAGADWIAEELSAMNYLRRPSLDNYKLRFLHRALEILTSQCRRKGAYSTNSIKILKTMIEAEADLHGLFKHGSMQDVTPLRRIADSYSDMLMYSDQERHERFKDKALNSSLRNWLKILHETNVDVRQYLREEERLAQELQPLIYSPWHFHGQIHGRSLNRHSKYVLEWHFECDGNDDTCGVSVEYVLDHSEKPAVQSRETQLEEKVPGAWIEED